MAKNDYSVIVYQLLAYLYECLKRDEDPCIEFLQVNAATFPIGPKYWAFIISSLLEDGLIAGACMVPILGGDVQGVKLTPKLRITTKGISYLQENGMMAKAREFLKSAIDVGGVLELIPGIIKEII